MPAEERASARARAGKREIERDPQRERRRRVTKRAGEKKRRRRRR